MVHAFHYSCEGESHKAINKVCQDYSLTENTDGFTVAIVCDGHGGERYFRSDIGAKFAAEASLDAVKYFVENVGSSFFEKKAYTAKGPAYARSEEEKTSVIDDAFQRLFASIIYKWNTKIDEHARSVPLTEWEIANVPQKYLDEFASNLSDENKSVEKQYGCTLMVYVQTKDYWFAFHLGDGKCISFQQSPVWDEPIPWDDRCFLNKTTSLCDTSAIDEFRYCYQGDGHFPIAIILGSDGLDDSMGETSNLANFYIQILKMLAKDGIHATEESLKDTLPKLSKIGSKDDMSVACVFNLEEVKSNIDIFIQYQVQLVKQQLESIEKRIQLLISRRDSLVSFSDDKSQIEFKYALQDLEKARVTRTNLARKYNLLAEELPNGTIPPYIIEEEMDQPLPQIEDVSSGGTDRDPKSEVENILEASEQDDNTSFEDTNNDSVVEQDTLSSSENCEQAQVSEIVEETNEANEENHSKEREIPIE